MDIKGPFSYSGNKFKIWKSHLKPIFDRYDKINEPFSGSAVCLYNSKSGGIAIDKDPNVVALHNGLKDPNLVQRMSDAYNRIFPDGRNEAGFYSLRNEFNSTYLTSGTTPENVHLLHLLVQLGFNSLLRFSSTGFNSPFGRKPIDLERIRIHSEIHRSKDIRFINGSYSDLPLDEIGKDELIYFDPPYAASKFKYGGWTKEDEIGLLSYIDMLDEMGYHFVLSNTFLHRGETNEELIQWASKYEIKHISMSYNSWAAAVSSVSNESDTDEVIVSNIPNVFDSPKSGPLF